MSTDVSAVVVSYRSAAFLPACLAGLREAAPGRSLETILVDNASPDGAPELVKRIAPRVRLVENPVNRGFAAAANQGAREAGGRFLLFLNPDARPAAGALEVLLQALVARPQAGLAAPRLVFPDGSPQLSAWPEPGLLALAVEALLQRPLAPLRGLGRGAGTGRGPVVVPCLSGACLLVERELFQAVGGFDERFFLYHEDWDLCLRARSAGRLCLLVPSVTAVHALGASAFQDRAAFWRLFHQSRDVFIRKHVPGLRGRAALLTQRLALDLHALVSGLAGRPEEARALRAARRALPAWGASLTSLRAGC